MINPSIISIIQNHLHANLSQWILKLNINTPLPQPVVHFNPKSDSTFILSNAPAYFHILKDQVKMSKNQFFTEFSKELQCENIGTRLYQEKKNMAILVQPQHQLLGDILPQFPALITPIQERASLNYVVGSPYDYESFENYKHFIIDYSAPNMAKQMHVGHLRSSIIGDSLSNIIEYNGYQVARINHVGDWGSQFGCIFSEWTMFHQDQPLTLDLANTLYSLGKSRKQTDSDFATKVDQATLALQNLTDPTILRNWQSLIDSSRKKLLEMYIRLGIGSGFTHSTFYEQGESWYSQMIGSHFPSQLPLVSEVWGENKQSLLDKNSTQHSREMKVIHSSKKSLPPLVFQKSNGGYTYDTTDCAALYYRLQHNPRGIYYVTDAGQSIHFETLFTIAQDLGWVESTKLYHVPFGIVQDSTGKRLRTSNSADSFLPSLNHLIDQAVEKSKESLSGLGTSWIDNDSTNSSTPEIPLNSPVDFIESTAEKLGIAGIKYNDLKSFRTSNYIYSLDKMLQNKGNSVVYCMYAYVRLASILRKAKELGIERDTFFDHSLPLVPESRVLLTSLFSMNDIFYQSQVQMAPSLLVDYVYTLSRLVQQFYHKVPVLTDENAGQLLFITWASRNTLQHCFRGLGIEPVEYL